LGGVQGGQFGAGPVQGVQFLLLMDLGGDVAAQADELVDTAAGSRDGSNVQFQVTVLGTVQAGRDRLAGQGSVERRIIGPQGFRRAQGFVETSAAGRAAAPVLEGGVGPGNPQLGMAIATPSSRASRMLSA